MISTFTAAIILLASALVIGIVAVISMNKSANRQAQAQALLFADDRVVAEVCNRTSRNGAWLWIGIATAAFGAAGIAYRFSLALFAPC